MSIFVQPSCLMNIGKKNILHKNSYQYTHADTLMRTKRVKEFKKERVDIIYI